MQYADLAHIIARNADFMSATEVLNLTDVLFPLYPKPVDDAGTHEGRVAIAKKTEAVILAAANDRRIQAIKELRNLTNCGLKEAKDAIDEAFPRPTYTPPPTPAYFHDTDDLY